MPYRTGSGLCDTDQINKWILRRIAEGKITQAQAALLNASPYNGNIETWLQAILAQGTRLTIRDNLSIGWACVGLPLEVIEDGANPGTRFLIRGLICDSVKIYNWLFGLASRGAITTADIRDLRTRWANVMDPWLLTLLQRGLPASFAASIFFICPYTQEAIPDGTLVTHPESAGKVWIIAGGQRREILARQQSGDVFRSCGYHFDQIKVYPQAQVEAHPIGAPVSWLGWQEGDPDCPYGTPLPRPPVGPPVPVVYPPPAGLPSVVQLIRDNFDPRGYTGPNGWITGTCIACYESGLNPSAHNASDHNGLFQIAQGHCGNCNLYDPLNNILWANNLIADRVARGQDPLADWANNTLEICRPDPVAALRSRCGINLSSYWQGGTAGSEVRGPQHKQKKLHKGAFAR